MDNNKKAIFLINQAIRKQKEANELLENSMKIISNLIKVDSLTEKEKNKFREETKKIVAKFIEKNGNVLEEKEQRQLFLQLKDVNYSKNGLAYVLRDSGMDIQYSYSYSDSDNQLAWKPMIINM